MSIKEARKFKTEGCPWNDTLTAIVGREPKGDRVVLGYAPSPTRAEFIALIANTRPLLLEAAEELANAIEKQLAMPGKGMAPSPRVAAALESARTAINAAKGNQQ